MNPSDDDAVAAAAASVNLPSAVASAWDRAEHQRLWLQLQRREWRTLAVVPAEAGMSTFEVANFIMAIGVHHGASVGVFDLRAVRMNRVLSTIEEACAQMIDGERLIFATGSIQENLATIPLARAVDGVILCVALGSTEIRQAEETVAQIGKDRFFGSMLLRGHRPQVSAPARASQLARVEVQW